MVATEYVATVVPAAVTVAASSTAVLTAATLYPTAAPTKAPTASPTKAPTESPTATPTSGAVFTVSGLPASPEWGFTIAGDVQAELAVGTPLCIAMQVFAVEAASHAAGQTTVEVTPHIILSALTAVDALMNTGPCDAGHGGGCLPLGC
jgi:hypothetical protein